MDLQLDSETHFARPEGKPATTHAVGNIVVIRGLLRRAAPLISTVYQSTMRLLDTAEVVPFTGRSRTRKAVSHYKRERLQRDIQPSLESESEDTSSSEDEEMRMQGRRQAHAMHVRIRDYDKDSDSTDGYGGEDEQKH
jgi:hypothetical protein